MVTSRLIRTAHYSRYNLDTTSSIALYVEEYDRRRVAQGQSLVADDAREVGRTEKQKGKGPFITNQSVISTTPSSTIELLDPPYIKALRLYTLQLKTTPYSAQRDNREAVSASAKGAPHEPRRLASHWETPMGSWTLDYPKDEGLLPTVQPNEPSLLTSSSHCPQSKLQRIWLASSGLPSASTIDPMTVNDEHNRCTSQGPTTIMGGHPPHEAPEPFFGVHRPPAPSGSPRLVIQSEIALTSGIAILPVEK
ncbi:uncharacterized protein BO95DRAFT_481104 [Aspergillus brunneoviolaceus CBS 621.78]|uniref:Uncharacterized protein n=1 Tax=Aspergillus brunneoviolaceus CBS 621.78 TaxID=1450534 RepID=A0ACD1GCP7_9EURO|nr:hypothetical protein BO95DRAFT_481104 [Aspergillus brunneoviolaceus CBS 621.78]RAH47031.1 hypothetical protein BO95DRAFT_481104 [Aspergillus brunneoviolaceus CBS 621.78]